MDRPPENAPSRQQGPGNRAARGPGVELLADLTRGACAAWGFVGLLVIALLVVSRRQLSGTWEVQNGLRGFLPAWLLASAPAGMLGALAVRPRLPRGVRGGLGAAFAGLVGWGISGGRHFAEPPVRAGFVVLLVLGGAGAGWAVGRWVVPLLERLSRRSQWALFAGMGAAAGLLEAVNHLVLVRLYPAFHAGLSVLSLACVGAAGALSSRRDAGSGVGAPGSFPWRLRSAWVAALGLGLAALLLRPASVHVRGFDNFRWVVGSSSPTLAWGLDLASWVAPPPPVDVAAQSAPLGSWAGRGGVNFRGRSILLVTVDALRADHVGAYGYSRPTTPALDRLAEQGVRFEQAYAPTPHTSYSVTSLLTGKYMRPLLLQGAGQDSELLANLLVTYGYKTAGLYPPAVFFIDTERFSRFSQSHLGFEYFKVEFAEGERRLAQLEEFVRAQPKEQPLFVWLHLFGPHEPYEDQPDVDFGRRDVDRYDEEILAADRTIGRAVELLRTHDEQLLTIATADHGEEFGEHGGRYHGTTVYEEQVRVPLILQGAELPSGVVLRQPVQTIDIVPTVLSGLNIPIPPRVRGRDLSPLLTAGYQESADAAGLALAETDDYVLLAERHWRLICERRSGACQLFDLSLDPLQKRDSSSAQPEVFARLKEQARTLAASHGLLEASGLRAEGKGWPDAIVRGISGDAEVAPELARLLEDADADIRAKSAEVLFGLARSSEAPALRLALSREDDPRARAYLALSLTRLGQGAPLVRELLTGDDPKLRHLAAVALAEQGIDAGEEVLLGWWLSQEKRSFAEDRMIVGALSKIGSEDAVGPLLQRLSDVRLRPFIAQALAAIGDKDAAPFLARALAEERYQSTRPALARALLALGANEHLILPLRHFLGVADPMPAGLEIAEQARILEDVGGPSARQLQSLRQLSSSGVEVSVIVPPVGKGIPQHGVQVVVRARVTGEGRRILLAPATVRAAASDEEGPSYRHQPLISSRDAVALVLEDGPGWQEKRAVLPEKFQARPGHHLGLAVFSETGVEVSALVAVPVREEVPPPPPEPWQSK